MKRVILLLALFSCGTSLVYAQDRGPTRPDDRKTVGGFTIQIIPAVAGSFGYDILSGARCMLHQPRNPFNGSPVGLTLKEDAYKVATWQIQQALPSGLPANQATDKLTPAARLRFNLIGARLNRRVPMSVAKELNISLPNQ